MLGARGSFRLFWETQKRKTLAGDKVVIYGAGRGGELLLREILNNKQLNVNPVGFVDDDPLKLGKKIQGYPILGSFEDLEPLHTKHGLLGILISFNDLDGRHKARHDLAKRFCSTHGIYLKRFKIDLMPVNLES
jgi:UDP-GlcNAc:undecaprenyl-phosphate GlcNAc-1-phosphate transferase